MEVIMKAVIIKHYGGPEVLQIDDIATPIPAIGEVLIKIHAFGLNRAECYMRQGAWGDVAKITGIECVGEIMEDPSGKLQRGDKVIALMGGMGRNRNGSYAEFTTIAATNVIPVQTHLSWTELAAIPESYSTAWACLHQNMHINAGDVILIRGGTSALGQAAINIASQIDGVTVIATTRSTHRFTFLKNLGCSEVYIEKNNIADKIRATHFDGIDSVLDIIGNSTLLDSLKLVKKGGFVCNAGFLGGGDAIKFNPLEDMPPGINLNFFASFLFGQKDFPLSDIPMQSIIKQAERGNYQCKPASVFAFNDIQKAHQLMESSQSMGKIVVQIMPN